ncbi:ABC transporter ATP-binding protein [Thalassotalea insulae]|uniref:ABC transporter ATP-binding protein n=1 Tax=Thalassotalea insulae TaxID=2056778 RepID=A0ABQ6GW56_9GAMM|nr:ABC transporter ATP-binding protein [Thalassotalea insulae]GLX80171.1 ABC transporter ATP-binding protein [Thalassotalea insulae]
MNEIAIKLTDVNKSYLMGEQPLHVLNHINLTIRSGDYISIMGPSGSGKSTLLNIIGMLDQIDSGAYQLLSKETSRLDEEQRALLRRQHIGFIFQNFHLIPRLTAFENASLPLMLDGKPLTERQEIVTPLFQQLGIEHRLHHLPKQLSGGQLQRVAIARATVMSPNILLADEPTGNLDQASGIEVIELLERLNTQGITLIVVTHDKALGKRARRQLTMVDGQIVKDSTNAIETESS